MGKERVRKNPFTVKLKIQDACVSNRLCGCQSGLVGLEILELFSAWKELRNHLVQPPGSY